MRPSFGDRHADIALAFAKSFHGKKGITARELDLWGMDQGQMGRIHDYDTTPRNSGAWSRMVAERNKMRKHINAGATSDAFMEGNVIGNGYCQPFAIDVDVVGETYLIREAGDSFQEKARVLPVKVGGFTKANCAGLERLKKAVNVMALPPGIQLQIDQYGRKVRKFERDVQRQRSDLEEEFSEIEAWINRNYGPPRLPKPDGSDGEPS